METPYSDEEQRKLTRDTLNRLHFIVLPENPSTSNGRSHVEEVRGLEIKYKLSGGKVPESTDSSDFDTLMEFKARVIELKEYTLDKNYFMLANLAAIICDFLTPSASEEVEIG